MSETDPIKLNHTTLGVMLRQGDGAEALRATIAASGHDNYNRALGIRSEAEARAILAGSTIQTQSVVNATKAGLQRGDIVIDTERKKKVTILASAGKSSKGTPIYSVADKYGNSWKQYETKLSRR